MKYRKLLLLLIGIFPLLNFLSGCAPNIAYHTLDGSKKNCVNQSNSKHCLASYYQEYDTFDLAFGEFSERGNAFNDDYIKHVLKRIEEHASDNNGIVLITFVHGWKHNADESDDNLKDFKGSLHNVSQLLKTKFGNTVFGKRRLVGFYVGWRGVNLEVPILENLTFWDRKAVAEEVGKGGVTRLLLDLDNIIGGKHKDDSKSIDKNNNVMLVVGHSFGGAILVSALNEMLMERVINTTNKKQYARALGDGVVLLNPAIEANQALNLVEAALRHNQNYQPEQRPLLISLSSDADWATHYAFPFGQTVGLLANWRQTDLEREYYYDREHPSLTTKLREEHLDTTTIGNFAPFLTHYLTKSEQDGKVRYDTCGNNPKACEPAGFTTLSGQPSIRTPKNYPLYFIRTDASIMNGHNDIFTVIIRKFLYAVINDVINNKLDNSLEKSYSILNKTDNILGKEIENNTN